MKVLKTAFLLTVLTLLLIYGGQALAGRQGMTFGLIMAFVMNGGAYFFSAKVALISSGARPVTREEAPRLYASVERLAARGQSARAQGIHHSPGRAERICHGPQSSPCRGRSHPGLDGFDE